MKLGVAAAVSLVLAGAGWAQVTQRVSVDSSGGQANSLSDYRSSLSSDGRFIAFGSFASNLVPGDTNGRFDVFVHDNATGSTERVSISSSGVQGNYDSGLGGGMSISGNGRYVAFQSNASNLVAGFSGNGGAVYLHDRRTGQTSVVSVNSQGIPANSGSGEPSITPDCRLIAFSSVGWNLVDGDNTWTWDVFVHDLQSGQTTRISVDPQGGQADADSHFPRISADGRYVAFQSSSTNLVAGDTNGTWDIFRRDLQTGQTILVSVDSQGIQGNDYSLYPCISADGRQVLFVSAATNLVPGDTNGIPDVFIHDCQTGSTLRCDVSSQGAQAEAARITFGADLTADARFVVFDSYARNLVPGDINSSRDVFLHDLHTGLTTRLSVSSDGTPGSADSYSPAVSADGRRVTFVSFADNLVPGDTNGTGDVFVRDLDSAHFMSFCEPGVGGTIGCPCGNGPSGGESGCDNSSHTGGAAIAARGSAYLSVESLTFTTTGERPSALSALMQGTDSDHAGEAFGQGVQCVRGTLNRLYTGNASGGSITMPGAGDLSVSARSAALGDLIQPGQSRYYMVYYRDPVVLGGCPASATFNATQTGQVTWWP